MGVESGDTSGAIASNVPGKKFHLSKQMQKAIEKHVQDWKSTGSGSNSKTASVSDV